MSQVERIEGTGIEFVQHEGGATTYMIPEEKVEETWQQRYEREKRERELRIRGINQHAIFALKSRMYAKIGVLIPTEEQRENPTDHIEALADGYMQYALRVFYQAAIELLDKRGLNDPRDWEEATNTSLVRHSVKMVVAEASGLPWY